MSLSRTKISVVTLVVIVTAMLSFAVSTAYAAVTLAVDETLDDDPAVDNGKCSLREAILAANTDTTVDSCVHDGSAGVDTITLPAGTYTLAPAYRELLITTDITINGDGADSTIIQASTCNPVTLPGNCTPTFHRVLHHNGGTVVISGVTIRHGTCGGSCPGSPISGGGIFNASGSLTLDASIVSSNKSSFGGGIYNSDTMIIQNGSVIGGAGAGNASTGNGGGIYNDGGVITIDASTVSANSALFTGLGGGICNHSGTLTVQNGSVIGGAGAGNTAYEGGGIWSQWGSTTTIDASTVSANSAGYGGGITNTNGATLIIQNGSVIGGAGAGNIATSAFGGGGGVYSSYGTTTIDASTVSANSAWHGGGVVNYGTLNIQNGSLIGGVGAGNTATGIGGGVANSGGTTTIDASTVSANSAPNGGGIANSWTTMIVQNGSVIGGVGAGNTATDGGGVYLSSGTLTITGSSLLSNTATNTGGAYYYRSGETSVTSSCIVGNSVVTVYNNTTTSLNFTGNWWGAANGPGPVGPGSGDTVSPDIDFSGFLTTAPAICPQPEPPPRPPAAHIIEPTAIPAPVIYDPTISKVGLPINATIDEEVVWTILVSNPSTYTLNAIFVNDPIPSTFDILEVTTTQGTSSVSGQVVTVDVGTIQPQQMATITIRTVANDQALPGQACNTATSGASTATGCVTLFPGDLPETGGSSPLIAAIYELLPLLGGIAVVGAGALALMRRRMA